MPSRSRVELTRVEMALNFAEKGQLGLHLLEHPSMGNSYPHLLGQSHGKGDFPGRKTAGAAGQQTHDADQFPLGENRQGEHTLDAFATGGLAKRQEGIFVDMGTVDRITGADHGQGFFGVDHLAGEIFQRNPVGGTKNKGTGGTVKQSDGAGIDEQQFRQTANNGVHHLLMVENHGSQPGDLLEHPKKLLFTGLCALHGHSFCYRLCIHCRHGDLRPSCHGLAFAARTFSTFSSSSIRSIGLTQYSSAPRLMASRAVSTVG